MVHQPPDRVRPHEPEVASGQAAAPHDEGGPLIPPEDAEDRTSFATRRRMPPALAALLAGLAGCRPSSET